MPTPFEFDPENLPGGTIPTAGEGFAAAAFITSSTDPELTSDLLTAEGVGVWAGYIEAPPAFTKTATSGICTFPAAGDIGTMSLVSDTIINHDIVITYKLTDQGSDSTIANLPAGGTTLQVAIVDGTDTIYQTPLSNPPQVDILSMRKFTNGVHDTIILRGRVLHSNADTVRIKFWAVNGDAINQVRINCFSVSWRMQTE
jgi:hypothetical protein